MPNLVGAIVSKRAAGPSPYAGTVNTVISGGSPFTDIFGRDAAPPPVQLVREQLNWAYSCSILNANLVASTNMRLFIKTRRGESKGAPSRLGWTKRVEAKVIDHLQKTGQQHVSDAQDVEEIKEHPMLDLLNRPCSPIENGVGMSRYTLFEITQRYQEVVGRCHWYIEQNGPRGTPSAIWVLAPQYTSEFGDYGPGAKVISRYIWAFGNAKHEYTPDEVMSFRMGDLATGGYTGGFSPLRACWEQAKLLRVSDALTASRLENGGRPDAVFVPEQDSNGFVSMMPEQAARLRAALKQQYAMGAAGSIMIAEFPGSLETISWPINDVIQAERLGLSLDMISAAYGVPNALLRPNTSSGGSRATVQAAQYLHACNAGMSRCRAFCEALNQFYVPMWDDSQRMFFWPDNPPGYEDPEQEFRLLELADNGGAVTRDEKRRMLRLEDADWAKQPLVPSNLVPTLPDGKPDPDYYKGRQTPEEDVGASAGKKPAAKPAQQQAGKPAPKKKPKKNGTKKAILKMAEALKSLVEGISAGHGVAPQADSADSEIVRELRDTGKLIENATAQSADKIAGEIRGALAKPASTSKETVRTVIRDAKGFVTEIRESARDATTAKNSVRERLLAAGYSEAEAEQRLAAPAPSHQEHSL